MSTYRTGANETVGQRSVLLDAGGAAGVTAAPSAPRAVDQDVGARSKPNANCDGSVRRSVGLAASVQPQPDSATRSTREDGRNRPGLVRSSRDTVRSETCARPGSDSSYCSFDGSFNTQHDCCESTTDRWFTTNSYLSLLSLVVSDRNITNGGQCVQMSDHGYAVLSQADAADTPISLLHWSSQSAIGTLDRVNRGYDGMRMHRRQARTSGAGPTNNQTDADSTVTGVGRPPGHAVAGQRSEV